MVKGLVSIIIPVFNGERFIRRAVASVGEQHYKNVEIIFVNDGSSDASGLLMDELAEGNPRIKAVHRNNGGPSSARNAGIDVAVGEFIMFLDVDDLLEPSKLSAQVKALQDNPSVGLVYSQYQVMFQGSDEIVQTQRGEAPMPFRELLAYRNWFGVMVPLLTRELIDQVGHFDEALRAGEDYDYWLRCAEHTEFLYLPGVVATYIMHDQQAHKDSPRMEVAQRQLLEKHFAADPVRRSCFLSYYYFEKARAQWAARSFIGCAASLALHAVSARSLARAKTARMLARLF